MHSDVKPLLTRTGCGNISPHRWEELLTFLIKIRGSLAERPSSTQASSNQQLLVHTAVIDDLISALKEAGRLLCSTF